MADAIEVARQALQAEREAMQQRLDQVERALQALGDRRPPAGRAARKRKQLPRGALTGGILAFLQAQGRMATHATDILAHLQREGAGPVGANPKDSLSNALARLAAQGRVVNIGGNRWRRQRRRG